MIKKMKGDSETRAFFEVIKFGRQHFRGFVQTEKLTKQASAAIPKIYAH